MKQLASHIFVACLAFAVPGVSAEEAAEEVHDLLDARWYAIELIVFERLPVMDYLSPESLVVTAPRSWPANLRELTEPVDEDTAELSEALTVEPSPRCIGYPMIDTETPLHPRLAARRLLASVPDGLNAWLAPLTLSPIRVAPEPEPDAFGLPRPAPETPGPVTGPTIGPDPDIEPADESLSPEAALLAASIEAFETGLAAYEDALWRSAFSLQQPVLDGAARAINRQSHLRPLLHRRWQQAVPPRDAPLAVRLGTDDRQPTLAGLPRVEGTLSVTVGRYLHAAFELWYHADTLGMRPLVPGLVDDDATVPTAAGPLPYMQLSESRRMRSGELHYLDHPKLGVIIRIDPVEPPPELLALWERMQTLEQQVNDAQLSSIN